MPVTEDEQTDGRRRKVENSAVFCWTRNCKNRHGYQILMKHEWRTSDSRTLNIKIPMFCIHRIQLRTCISCFSGDREPLWKANIIFLEIVQYSIRREPAKLKWS